MKFIILIATIAIITACKKDNSEINLPLAIKYVDLSCKKKTNQKDTVTNMIIGTYDWAYTYFRARGREAEIWSPYTKMITFRYIFKPNAEVDYFENKKLQWTNNYVVDYEFKISNFYQDSSIFVIINDKISGIRKEYYRVFLCNDSAKFYNPYSSFDVVKYFSRK